MVMRGQTPTVASDGGEAEGAVVYAGLATIGTSTASIPSDTSFHNSPNSHIPLPPFLGLCAGN